MGKRLSSLTFRWKIEAICTFACNDENLHDSVATSFYQTFPFPSVQDSTGMWENWKTHNYIEKERKSQHLNIGGKRIKGAHHPKISYGIQLTVTLVFLSGFEWNFDYTLLPLCWPSGHDLQVLAPHWQAFQAGKTQISGIVLRCASHPGAKQMHLHFFTLSCPFCPCAGPEPKTSPEAAMGGGVGPLNVALESVTTERVGRFSHGLPQTQVNIWIF